MIDTYKKRQEAFNTLIECVKAYEEAKNYVSSKFGEERIPNEYLFKRKIDDAVYAYVEAMKQDNKAANIARLD